MWLKSLFLRGSIGIYYGLGIDEIYIPLTALNPGLVAITGPNGIGKTTLMEMMQPFLRLGSRTGNIEDHFRLKDSRKILIWEDDEGNEITSDFIIDGETKDGEFYLYKNGVALDDSGKKTPYKKALEEHIGSAKLFFSSVFASQNNSGIISRTTGELRELFYDLLGLKVYEKYHLAAKKELEKEALRRSELMGEIYQLKLSIENNKVSKEDFDEAKKSEIGFRKNIIQCENEIESLSKHIQKLRDEKAMLELRKEQNDELVELIRNRETELQGNETQFNFEKEKLENDLKVFGDQFEKDNIYDAEILFLEQRIPIEKNEAGDRLFSITEREEELQKEIIELDNMVSESENNIKNCQSILGKSALIKEKVKRKSELRELIQKSMASDQFASGQKSELLSEWNKKKDELSLKNLEKQKHLNSIAILEKDKHKIINEIEKINNDKFNELTKLKLELNNIKDIPCDSELGVICPLLNALNNKKKLLPEIEKNYDFLIGVQEVAKDKNTTKRNVINSSLEAVDKLIGNIEDFIEEKFKTKITELELCSDEHKVEIKKYLSELSELSKPELDNKSWEELDKELSQAQIKIDSNEEKIRTSKLFLENKNKELESNKLEKSIIQKTLSETIKVLEKQIFKTQELKKKDKETYLRELKQKLSTLITNHNSEKKKIRFEIESLEGKLTPTIGAKLEEKDIELQNLVRSAEEMKNILREERSNLEESTKVLIELNNKFILKKQNEDDLLSKEAELQIIEKNIKEWTILIQAFDKTGIPILKLENSGEEITEMANELLSVFNNKYRIALDTTGLNAKGELKEIFEISILDEQGLTNAKNKSGGQQVWLNEALQMAISLYKRKRGINIRTSFIDERDGSLDIENAYNFIEMVTKVHDMSQVHNTFIITQRSEILNTIPQKIELRDGTVSIINDAA